MLISENEGICGFCPTVSPHVAKSICNFIFNNLDAFGHLPTESVVAKEYTDTIENFKVIKVRDGDTFVITIEDTPDVFGEKIVVRVIGIDTPELNDKREEIKATAIKAKEELEKLLTSWKKIVLYNLALLLAVAVEINILDCWQV